MDIVIGGLRRNSYFDLDTPLSAVSLGLWDPLWPEIFENLAVGLTFYALQNGQQLFLKFDPWPEIWHLEVTHLFYF